MEQRGKGDEHDWELHAPASRQGIPEWLHMYGAESMHAVVWTITLEVFHALEQPISAAPLRFGYLSMMILLTNSTYNRTSSAVALCGIFGHEGFLGPSYSS